MQDLVKTTLFFEANPIVSRANNTMLSYILSQYTGTSTFSVLYLNHNRYSIIGPVDKILNFHTRSVYNKLTEGFF